MPTDQLSSTRRRLVCVKSLDEAVQREVRLRLCHGTKHLCLEYELGADGALHVKLQSALSVPLDQPAEWRIAAEQALAHWLPPIAKYFASGGRLAGDEEEEHKADDDEAGALVLAPPDGMSNEVRVLLSGKVYEALAAAPRHVFRLEDTSATVCWAWRSGEPAVAAAINAVAAADSSSAASGADFCFVFDLRFRAEEGLDLKVLHKALHERWRFSRHEAEQVLHGFPDEGRVDPQRAAEICARLQRFVLRPEPGLELHEDEATILLELFPLACRVSVSLLAGGFSGARVFRCTERALNGAESAPVVVKVDAENNLRDEIVRMERVAPTLGGNAPSVLGVAFSRGCGGAKIELCGASWGLPGLTSKISISTFKAVYQAEQESRAAAAPAGIPAAGARQAAVAAEVETVLCQVFGEILVKGAKAARDEKGSLFAPDAYDFARQVKKHVFGATDEGVLDILGGPGSRALVERWTGSPLGDDAATYLGNFARRLDEYNASASPKTRRVGVVHGDLNGANIIVDSEYVVWLIDFAFAGPGPVLQDVAKLENTILFEYTQDVSPAAFCKFLEALVDAGARPPKSLAACGIGLEERGFHALELAWQAVACIRQHAHGYCDDDQERALMLHAGLAFYAIKTLSFVDVDIGRKRLALAAALAHASRVLVHLGAIEGSQPRKMSAPLAMDAAEMARLSWRMLERERQRYRRFMATRHAQSVDPVTRWLVSIPDCETLRATPVSLLDAEERQAAQDAAATRDVRAMQLALLLGQARCAIRDVLMRDSELVTGCLPGPLVRAVLVSPEAKLRLAELGLVIDESQVEERCQTEMLFQLCPTTSASELEDDVLLLLIADLCGRDAVKDVCAIRPPEQEGEVLARLSAVLPGDFNLVRDRCIGVLGPASSGKSLVLKRIAACAAKELDANSPLPLHVPLIELGRLVLRLGLSGSDDLLRVYLEASFGEHSPKAHFLRRTLACGRMLLLLDGLDEAGRAANVIVAWLERFSKASCQHRFVVSSRRVGMDEPLARLERNAGFQFGMLQPLAAYMMESIVTKRTKVLAEKAGVSHESLCSFVLTKAQLPEYSMFAANPLLLNLLVQVLSGLRSGSSPPASPGPEEGAMSKTQVFAAAVAQMLRASDATKYRRRSGEQDRALERDFDLLCSREAMRIFRALALKAHAAGQVAMPLEVLADVVIELLEEKREGDEEDEETATFGATRLERVHDGIRRCVARAQVPLFSPQERGAALAFSHLAIQQFLAAEELAHRLRACARTGGPQPSAAFCQLIAEHVGGARLESTWWREVFLFLCDILHSASETALLQKILELLVAAAPAPAEGVAASGDALNQLWLAVAASGNQTVFRALLDMSERLGAASGSRVEHCGVAELLQVCDGAGNTFLHHVAEMDCLALLRQAHSSIERGTFTKACRVPNADGHTAAGVALLRGNLECYRLLTRTPGDEDIEQEDPGSVPDLVAAVKASDRQRIETLLRKDPGAVLRSSGSTGLNAFLWAVIADDIDCAKLLASHADTRRLIDCTSRSGTNGLGFAVEHNAHKCAAFLLEQGASATSETSQGDSMLLTATSFGHHGIAALLLEHGANAAEALVVAAVQGRGAFVEELLNMTGAPAVDAVLEDVGIHALGGACVAGHLQTARVLIASGADVDCPMDARSGTCALHLAVKGGVLRVVDLLLEHGANVNTAAPIGSKATQGVTALSIAQAESSGTSQAIRDLLLAHGAKEWSDMTDDERDANTARFEDAFGRHSKGARPRR